jgi:hypothetical protein
VFHLRLEEAVSGVGVALAQLVQQDFVQARKYSRSFCAPLLAERFERSLQAF